MRFLVVLSFLIFGSPLRAQSLFEEPVPLTQETFRKAFLKLKDLTEGNFGPRLECKPPEDEDQLQDVSVIDYKQAEKHLLIKQGMRRKERISSIIS